VEGGDAPLIPFLFWLDTTPTWRCAQIEDTSDTLDLSTLLLISAEL
jgi:hypothetical protein